MSAPVPLDATHDPARRSWVAAANAPGADFPLQNLPFGVFRSGTVAPRVGVAIGASVLDLRAALETGVLELPLLPAEACCAGRLNELMGLGTAARREVRHAVHEVLSEGSLLGRDRAAQERVLLSAADVELLRPADVGDYTDFYASLDHATNVGSMFRPNDPLLPNYKWVPIGYHGRASSVVVGGTPVQRPLGQTKAPDAAAPAFGPTRQLDYELEVGAWVAAGNALGEPVPLARAGDHLFGVSLLNDWSARDVQAWEYQPLGPFLAKNFLTSVSPWVVTMEALAPFRAPAPPRPVGDPRPLPYLDDPADRAAGALALALEVRLASARMREAGIEPVRVGRSDFARTYWTLGQLVAHHTANGCNLRPGDLLGSGTVSGPERGQRGCLLEATWRGKEPLELPTGERRAFLEDGDEVVMTGWCERPGTARIGLGECRGVVRPAQGC